MHRAGVIFRFRRSGRNRTRQHSQSANKLSDALHL